MEEAEARDGKITRGNNSRSVSLEPKSPTIDWSLFNTSTPDPCRWSPLVASGRIHIILGQPAATRCPSCAWPRPNSAIPGQNSVSGSNTLRASLTASVLSRTPTHPASPFLSRCLPVNPILISFGHRKCSSYRAPFLDFITVWVHRFQ